MKRKIIIISSVILVIVIILAAVFSGGNKQIIAKTDTASAANIVSVLKQTGVIKPQVGAMVSIGARITGTLDKVDVKVGDNVTKGQLLAKIDSRSIKQTIKQAKDALQKAQSDLAKLKQVYPIQVDMQKNTIESAKTSYDYLLGVYERERILYDKGYSRKETLEKAYYDMVSAKTEYEKQKLQLEYMLSDYNSNLTTYTAEVRRQQSLLEEQQINLTYAEIYSPINGIVSSVNSVEGETIVTGLEVAKLITIFRPELMEMFVYVDESDIGKVREGMEVDYSVDTFPDKVFTGTVSRINLQSETKDGVIYYVAIVGISKEDALTLRAEMTTNATIIINKKDVPVSVDNSAIKWENGKQIVYIVRDAHKNTTEVVEVKTGARGERRTEIVEGLKAGDIVVVKFGQPGDNSDGI